MEHQINYWTEEQKNFLIQYYPTKGAIWVAERVNHSSACCRYMAGRLNVKFIKTNEWKSTEIEIVRKYYPILGKFVTNLLPNRSISSCLYMANKLGVAYKKKYSSTIEQIKKILEQKQISYKQEVGFKECTDKGMLLFDIAIYDNEDKSSLIGLIEYDGTQHFLQTTAYQDKNISAETVFKNTQRRDQIKNGFCREFQIPLLRIRYDQRNLEELITLFLNNLKNFTNWYNPYLSYDEYYNNKVDEEFKQHYIHFSKYKKNIKHDDSKDIRFCFNRWTMDEELYLEKYYPDKGSVWVSKYLHRSPKACALKAHKLGLHRNSIWKKEDDIFLIKNYNEKDARWISKQLNRTESSIRHRVRDLKLKKDSIKWKKIEDDYIIENHTIKKNIEIANDLNRSLSAVKTRSEYLKKHQAAEFYNNDSAKVISISAILAKLLENRKTIIIPKPNSTNYRGQLYLHINQVQKDILKYRDELNLPRKIQYSYIVARANLVDCKLINEIELQEIKKNYHEYIYNKCHVGKYIWILEDIEIIENPIHAIGNTNIWEYDLQLAKEENR